MGVILNKNIDSDILFGLWEIKESYNELFLLLDLNQEELERLESFKSHSRKIEWLSVRALLAELNGKGYKIVYNGNRKPYLHDRSQNISISHAEKLTGILLSKSKRIGIDMEFMSHRISRIAHKFINNSEYITDDESLKRIHLYIHWCAKEALYKICDKQDINFKKNLTLLPFRPLDFGTITGFVDNKFGHEEFQIEYFTKGNYIIAYTAK